MASTWTCADAHTHDLSSKYDSRSPQGVGTECITCGDRITGWQYSSKTPTREYTRSSNSEAAAS